MHELKEALNLEYLLGLGLGLGLKNKSWGSRQDVFVLMFVDFI
jgi:hypothetical protein